MNKTRKDVIAAGKKGVKQACANWNLHGNFHLLKQTVVAHLAAKEAKEKDSGNATGIVPAGDVIIPRTTIQRHADRFKTVAKEKNPPLHCLTSNMIFPKARGGGGKRN